MSWLNFWFGGATQHRGGSGMYDTFWLRILAVVGVLVFCIAYDLAYR